MAVIGRLAGPVPQFNTAALIFRRINIRGVFVGGYAPGEARAAWDSIVAAMDRSNQRPLVDRVFTFQQLLQAFQRLREGPLGKVLVSMNP